MIYRRKRPHRRRVFEQELARGQFTFLHEPQNIAARDFVVERKNLNPFRDGTDEHAIYEDAFAKCKKELTEEWKHRNAPTKNARRHG